MQPFAPSDPVVYVGQDLAVLGNEVESPVGTVVAVADGFVTVCDDETGSLFKVPANDLSYPEGLTLEDVEQNREVIVRRPLRPSDSHVTLCDIGDGVSEALDTTTLVSAWLRPASAGRRVFPAGAPVLFVGSDTAELQFMGVGHVVRSHFDITTVRLADGALIVVETFDLSFPRGVRIHSTADQWTYPTLDPKPSVTDAVHMTHTFGGWQPTSDLTVHSTNAMVAPQDALRTVVTRSWAGAGDQTS